MSSIDQAGNIHDRRGRFDGHIQAEVAATLAGSPSDGYDRSELARLAGVAERGYDSRDLACLQLAMPDGWQLRHAKSISTLAVSTGTGS